MSKSAEHAAEDLQATLAGISTKDLVDELSKREWVTEHTCPNPVSGYCIVIDTFGKSTKRERNVFPGTGPVRILVVRD